MDVLIIIAIVANVLTLLTNLAIFFQVRSRKPASSITMKVHSMELEVNPDGQITRVTF